MTLGRPASRPPEPAAAAVSPEVRRLLRAAIAGKKYREDAWPAVEADLRAAPRAELARALAAGHLAAQFVTAFGPLVPRGRLRTELRDAVRAQGRYAAELLRQFHEVRQALAGLSADPVVLKGPGLWGWAYPDPALRRSRDLDLLVSDPGDLRRAVAALRALGFDGNDAAIGRALDTVEHYELPTLTRRIRARVPRGDEPAIARLRARYPELVDFRPANDGYEIKVEVELHRGLFLFRDGTVPTLPDELRTPHPLLPGYARLTLPAQLAYLAAKFGLDTEGSPTAPPQAQSLKLLADVVRLVDLAEPPQLGEAVAMARAWRCDRLFARTLATAAPLLPDVAFTGMAQPPYDLDALVARAALPPPAAAAA